MTQKACFLLRIRPECIGEYSERHENLWPEMRVALVAAGYRNYSIFVDATGLLVGYFESDDVGRSASEMASQPVTARWSREIGWMFLPVHGGDLDDGHRHLTRVFDLDESAITAARG